MKFRSFSHYVLALLAALVLAACGGSGADRNPDLGGPVSIAPESGTFYAGIPAKIRLQGGRPPYSLTSSEPGVLPVPDIVHGNVVEVIPNQPGVVDSGLDAGALQVRTVIVTMRDSTGIRVSAEIKVAQNFLTGYGISMGASTCQDVDTPVCAGGETTLLIGATFNGALHGDEKFEIEKVRGPYHFVWPLGSNTLVDKVPPNGLTELRSDHHGIVTFVIRVDGGTPTTVAILRVRHVATGASNEISFTISGTAATASLTLIPPEITLTGASSAQCGTGSADFQVFDGQPPYKASCFDSSLVISPLDPLTSDTGRFTITATNPNVCLDKAQCVITDNTGRRVIMEVTTKKGPAAPAPPTMTISPTTLTLACGASGTVLVVGGSGPPYSVSSSHPRVTAVVVSTNRVTITRLQADPAVPASQPITAIVSITDGATIKDVTVTIIPDAPGGKCA